MPSPTPNVDAQAPNGLDPAASERARRGHQTRKARQAATRARIEARQRFVEEVFALVDAGLTWRAIGVQLHCSQAWAYETWTRTRAARNAAHEATIDERRQAMVDRIGRMVTPYYLDALKGGDHDSFRSALAGMAEQAKLQGLHAPQQIDFDGDFHIEGEVTDEALLLKIATVFVDVELAEEQAALGTAESNGHGEVIDAEVVD